VCVSLGRRVTILPCSPGFHVYSTPRSGAWRRNHDLHVAAQAFQEAEQPVGGETDFNAVGSWYNPDMDKLLHNVGDLPSPERFAVESIIGHALRDDQQLYIVALDAAAQLAAEVRRHAWSELEEIIAEAHSNVCTSGVAPQQLEQTIDEACNEVRDGS
jgi:hypothetical protein